jgi:hypothetical protein
MSTDHHLTHVCLLLFACFLVLPSMPHILERRIVLSGCCDGFGVIDAIGI